jgi:hypothetical protein
LTGRRRNKDESLLKSILRDKDDDCPEARNQKAPFLQFISPVHETLQYGMVLQMTSSYRDLIVAAVESQTSTLGASVITSPQPVSNAYGFSRIGRCRPCAADHYPSLLVPGASIGENGTPRVDWDYFTTRNVG